jgi:hypothetical protein
VHSAEGVACLLGKAGMLLNPSQLIGIKGNFPSANVCNRKRLFAHISKLHSLIGILLKMPKRFASQTGVIK